MSSGAITGFGSIFVNGVEWETNSNTTITVDDNPGSESDLNVGQVVTVRGTLDAAGTSGTADAVEFDNSVEGPIVSISLASGSFDVLGQTVFVSADTGFDDSNPDIVNDGQRQLNDLQVGDVVEVSGYRDAVVAVQATYVEVRGGAGDFEAMGIVTNLTASTFRIGTLTVSYTPQVLEGFGSDTLSDGDVVEVKGSSFAAGVLAATVVEREDDLSGESGEDSEVEGYITRFASPTDFEVAGVKVTTHSGTDFEGGTSTDLALDLKVEVEGEVNTVGVLVADKVQIRVQPEDADVELEGDVASVSVANGTLTLQGMDIILVKVNAATLVEDESDADVEGFSLADVVVGDHVEIRGADDASMPSDTDVIATRLERRNDNNEVKLQGAIQDVLEPDLTILGVTVRTDSAAFRDPEDNPISAGTFFSTVDVGDVVKAKTDALGVGANILTAEEVQLEEPD